MTMTLFIKKVQAVVAATLTFVLFAFLLLLVVINFELSEQNRELNLLNRFTALIVNDVAQSLRTLNNFENKECTPKLLAQMQKVLITSKFVKETGLVNDSHILCNTSSGILSPPLMKMPIDFDTGRGINVYVDIPLPSFESTETAPLVLVAESGQFYVAIDRSYISLTGVASNRWEVIHYLDGKVNHVLGTFGIFDREHHQAPTEVSFIQGIFSSWCNPHTHYCSVLHVTWSQVLEHHAWIVSFVTLLGLIVSYLVFVWLYPFSHKQKARLFRVQNAVENDSFHCVYQPIVELETGITIGFEMLSRLKDRYGELTPDQFIPEIKQLEKTWGFTLNQVNKAIKDMGSMPNRADLKLSFNIFPEDLTAENVNQLIDLCKQSKDVQNFNIEIVEEEVLDTPLAAELIELLAKNSIQTSIDDFGTGYSNLSKFGDFTCDYVKIDRAFIANIDKGSLLSTLVPQIQQIAQQFKLETVAEGIETKEQERILLGLGIKYGQGWHYGKPLPMSYWRNRGLLTR